MTPTRKLLDNLKYLEEGIISNKPSTYILREIRLKASDGTNLKQTKLGGKPNWIQNDETPVCPSCRERMTFVGQIDSFDDNWQTLKGDDRYYFTDDGMLYIFFPYCDCGEDPVVIGQFY